MDHKQTLQPYIQSQLSAGTPTDIIRQQLVERGWAADVVDAALQDYATAMSTPPTPPPPPESTSVQLAQSSEPVQPLAARRVSLQPIHDVPHIEQLPSRQAQTPSSDEEPATTGKPTVETTSPTGNDSHLLAPNGPLTASGEAPNDNPPQVVASVRYGVTTALNDALAAVRHNGLAVGVAAAIAGIVTAAVIVLAIVGLAFWVMTSIYSTVLAPQSDSAWTGLMSLLVWFIATPILPILVAALAQTLIGLAVNDGADGKKSAIGWLLATGFKRFGRVVVAMALYAVVVLAPLIIISLFGVASAVLLPVDIRPILSIITFLLSAASIVVMIILSLRYSLMPIVALLETDTPLTKLYQRTRHLTRDGGTWFVFKCLLAVNAFNWLVSTMLSGSSTGIEVSIIIALLMAIVYILYMAILVLFYRNRHLVRG